MSLSMEEDVTDESIGTGNTGSTFLGRGGGGQRRYVLVEATALPANSTSRSKRHGRHLVWSQGSFGQGPPCWTDPLSALSTSFI